jgi:hypothetical protein
MNKKNKTNIQQLNLKLFNIDAYMNYLIVNLKNIEFLDKKEGLFHGKITIQKLMK